MKQCIPEANLEGQGWKTTLFINYLVLTWGLRKRTLRPLRTLCIEVSRKLNLHFMFYLRYYKNGKKFKQKLTSGFKNHMRNLDNFR